ncbi:hypothetical protein SDC9_107025 [bioreactor metagenome]|uniref:Uncharacterized protein n=1 Tax=bioreactor metagenome TaxID=1076179 RepID=A0A645B443_9ZZZZ
MKSRAQGGVITARTMRDTLPQTEIGVMIGDHPKMVIIRIDHPITRTDHRIIKTGHPIIRIGSLIIQIGHPITRIGRTIRKDPPTTLITTGIPVRTITVGMAKEA